MYFLILCVCAAGGTIIPSKILDSSCHATWLLTFDAMLLGFLLERQAYITCFVLEYRTGFAYCFLHIIFCECALFAQNAI